jgi:xanthine/uracil/vitamin C permease (AzgA family)
MHPLPRRTQTHAPAGFIDDKARFPRRLITLCVDGVAILIGSLLGTSPLTVVAESSGESPFN